MKFIITLIISLTTFNELFAQIEKMEAFDLTKDGIKDHLEFSVNETVIRTEEDNNGDGKIDQKTIFNDKIYYRIELQDVNYDGKFERKKSYLMLPESKSNLITELDKNGDGVFEIRYEELLNNIEKQDACFSKVEEKVKELSATVLKAVSKTDKGLLPTGLGYKVDYECYQKWGTDFNQIVKDAALGGLQCLMDLDKKGRIGKKQTGAIKNAFNLTKLMKNDGISLMCSEEKYDWSGTMAHASVAPHEKMPSKAEITHPFVSINPKYPEGSLADRDAEVAELKDTIFHETLHTLGIRHEENIEFAYTCSKCCFDKKADADVKDQACKVCTGNYTNETDPNYITDFVAYTKLTFQHERGSSAVKKFMKENEKSTSGVSTLAYTQSGSFNPIGGELANIINTKNLKLTDTDKKYLTDANFPQSPIFKEFKNSSVAIANSYYELYYNKNGVSAIDSLEKNKVAIKAELQKMKKEKGNTGYTYDSVKESLQRVIHDMWLNNYPDKATGQKAYELNNFFNED